MIDACERDSRTIQIIGQEAMERLRAANVLIVGIGGVGSYAAEALSRTGIGTLCLMDGDEVAVSNMNRQLIALQSTLGRNKAELMAERVSDINPSAEVSAIPHFYGRQDSPELDLSKFDWVVDAIDDVDAKLALIIEAKASGVNIISAMGAAGKLDTHFKVSDISKTTVCPLARVMRRRLKAAGIESLPVVFSEEKPVPRNGELGSMSYVPGSMGLELAGYVIKSYICSEE